jgi:hypothetical protein
MFYSTAFTPAFRTLDALDTVYSLIKAHVTRENAVKVISAMVYGIAFVGAIAYYLGQAIAEHYADQTVDIADGGPDDDLDAITDDFFAPLFEAVTLAPVGLTYDDLNALGVVTLRTKCQIAGITWRNANGPSKHLTKNQIIGELL